MTKQAVGDLAEQIVADVFPSMDRQNAARYIEQVSKRLTEILKAKEAEITRLTAENLILRNKLDTTPSMFPDDAFRPTSVIEAHQKRRDELLARAESAEAKLKQIRELIVRERDKYPGWKNRALDDLLRVIEGL